MLGKFSRLLCFIIVTAAICAKTPVTNAQTDGNPHNWDRRRRCDELDYDPPCTICEGYGGIPYGDAEDDIILTTCEPIAPASDIDPKTVKPVLWGTVWSLSVSYEILIGKKNDPFCMGVFPGPDSEGHLCYIEQTSTGKYYDMEVTKAYLRNLNVKTIFGNVSATILHQGETLWHVNTMPVDIEHCACVLPRGGPNPIYPVQYNWIDELVFVGRERLAIEYIDQTLDVDHWVFGPHHVWTKTEDGNIIRLYNAFGGLNVYPEGVAQGTVDRAVFQIPPPQCKKEGGAPVRQGCDDDGWPLPEAAIEQGTDGDISLLDQVRAESKIPRHDYKGMDFAHMSQVLNNWLNSSSSNNGVNVKACEQWDVEEIQKLQALLYMLRESRFDYIYQSTTDNRRLQYEVLNDIGSSWIELNKVAAQHRNPMMKRMRRDGHCHEAVMWFVHHLTHDLKQILQQSGLAIPLLSSTEHECDANDVTDEGRVCSAYQKQVTCASCHSNVLPPSS